MNSTINQNHAKVIQTKSNHIYRFATEILNVFIEHITLRNKCYITIT